MEEVKEIKEAISEYDSGAITADELVVKLMSISRYWN